jgi:hypothetical protein
LKRVVHQTVHAIQANNKERTTKNNQEVIMIGRQRLTGISVDVSAATSSSASDYFQKAIEKLLDVLKAYDDDSAVAPKLRLYSNGVPRQQQQQQHSSTTPGGRQKHDAFFQFANEYVSWWKNTLLQRNDVAQIAVDATNLLVAEQATALCTRIIGVRATTESSQQPQQDDDDKSTSSATTTTIRRH